MKIQERLEMSILNDIEYYKLKYLRKYLGDTLFYVPKEASDKTFYSEAEALHNPEKTIKYCFNIFYHDGLFLKAIYYFLVKNESFQEEGCYWLYPEEYDDYKNVVFEFGFNDPDWSVSVSEIECFEYVKIACKRFLEIHREEKYCIFIDNALMNWKAKFP